jgi:hypothetical protein
LSCEQLRNFFNNSVISAWQMLINDV